MMHDPYLNALRCNYGYAVTCNKAQGGEWDEVYIDMPRNITLNPAKPDYQWVYTAMTRARKTLHLVNDFFYSS
jgi:ATP-dependent exoDNAse (exonuclease V) alpha subunit